MESENIWGREKLLDHLASVALFKSLYASQKYNLLNSSKVESFENGRIVCHQSDIPEHVFLILKGSIKKFRTCEEGNSCILQLLYPGNTFMEPFAFTKEPAPFSAQTIGETSLLAISAPAIHKLACNDSNFSQNMLRVISEHHRQALLKIASMTKSPLQRTASYLLNLAVESENLIFKLPHQKSLIASYLGITPETFSRSLSELRKAGIVTRREKVSLDTKYSLCQFCELETAAKCKNSGLPECRWENRLKH